MLGEPLCDVYLNEVAYWSNIPLRVWEYTIGGYQVIKKWLSYREKKLLGRATDERGSPLRAGDGPPHRRHTSARTGTRRELSEREGAHLPVEGMTVPRLHYDL